MFQLREVVRHISNKRKIDKQRKVLVYLLKSFDYADATIKHTLESIQQESEFLFKQIEEDNKTLHSHNLSMKIKLKFELMMLNKMCQNLAIIEKNPELNKAYKELVHCMKIKSGDESCQAALKLLLLAENPDRLMELKHANDILYGIANKEDADKLFGYILALNFSQHGYVKTFYMTHQKVSKNVRTLVNAHLKSYNYLINLNKQAIQDPGASITRRNLLYKVGLLADHLQRDPEEQRLYDAQLLAAREDKARLLIDIKNKTPLLLIDIGPAGGATFNEVMRLAKDHKSVTYCGVEFDTHELSTLQRMQLEMKTKSPEFSHADPEALEKAQFIEGNALALMDVIRKYKKAAEHVQNNFIAIVLSSVIHEIYSYCPYRPEPEKQDLYQSDFLNRTSKMTEMSDQYTYNQKTIAKIYREALLTLKDNPAGGTLNIRDGVMYENPTEAVTFIITSEPWIKMLNLFLEDNKYKHLKKFLNKIPITKGIMITLPAQYVQEFMIKANWGTESFGNEINEVYCYMRRKDHVELIERLAKDLEMIIAISSNEYTQDGYKQHITDKDIVIYQGFGENKFPPTNMIIRVEFVPPQLKLNPTL